MSGLAEILLKNGCRVSGSDARDSHLTEKLSKMGALIHIGHSAKNIDKPDLVVYSAAIKPDNCEYQAARGSGAVIYDRAKLLGELMKLYEYPVAVSGTHGKTTATSMFAHVLLAAELDPTVLVGGELKAIGGNVRTGESGYFVSEACEYHQSFLRFFPLVSIILNIEEDHLDYFRDLEHIIETFNKLSMITPDTGAVVINADDENVKKAVMGTSKNIITFSREGEADYSAKNIAYGEKGFAAYDLYERGAFACRINLSVPGAHNISNSLGVIAAARFLDIEIGDIAEGLLSYTGVGRRFEYVGTRREVTVIDDYAHHPTEIKATIKAARAACNGDIWCVFQPHTYTRTLALFDDFVRALSGDVKVIVLDIYAAREADTGLVNAKMVADKIPASVYMPDFDDAVDYLHKNAKPNDMIITMGAGDVYKIGKKFVEQ